MPRSVLAVIAVLFISTSVGIAAASTGNLPSPVTDSTSVEEQWFLYELNRARANPTSYGTEHGVSLDLHPRPPLAINANLAVTTGFKTEEMLSYSYCGHRSPATGISPNQLLRDSGFPLPEWWDGDENYSEAIWCSNGRKTPVSPLVFLGSRSRDHIDQVLGQGPWADYREAGVGISRDPQQGVALTLHVGKREVTTLFVTGVVFSDFDGDGIMDLGEGLAGIDVTVGGSSVTTNAGGGYAVPVSPGDYWVRVSGASPSHLLVSTDNVGVDFQTIATSGVGG